MTSKQRLGYHAPFSYLDIPMPGAHAPPFWVVSLKNNGCYLQIIFVFNCQLGIFMQLSSKQHVRWLLIDGAHTLQEKLPVLCEHGTSGQICEEHATKILTA
uniref:Uncharacterized protein n=1 Tax=Pelagomonas calceolata TaxID=35677 RepID=A0A7S4A8A3_9STRA|mmetsp:Transcript_17097/g.48756  ORF Transcript_17097/g.48756 Transcript_17097/m.48756 type:complete len:101 (+) Transcript_17097:1254-1556(+)